jgi:hypothetical protein
MYEMSAPRSWPTRTMLRFSVVASSGMGGAFGLENGYLKQLAIVDSASFSFIHSDELFVS